MKKNISPNSNLIIANGLALFIGSIFDTSSHRHHAIQITFGIEKKFDLELGGKLIQSRAIIINSDIEHKLVGKNDKQVLLLIEPESLYGVAIRNTIESKLSVLNSDHTFPPIFYKKLKTLVLSEHVYIKEVLNLIFSYLDISASTTRELDERLRSVVKLIEKNDQRKMTIGELADHVSLSESRLQHLFKDQVGISIKRYLLWKKMMDGIRIIASNNNFTFSAHEAGFSDSSHMSRTCKEMFGLTLSDLFKSSSSVQVFIEDY